jgi:hypothetical protein
MPNIQSRCFQVGAQHDARAAMQAGLVDGQVGERAADNGLVPAGPPLQVVDGCRAEAREPPAGERFPGLVGVHAGQPVWPPPADRLRVLSPDHWSPARWWRRTIRRRRCCTEIVRIATSVIQTGAYCGISQWDHQ